MGYAGNPAAIDHRLTELSREWDTERVVEANASALTLLGLGLDMLVNRRWLLLAAVVPAFLFQHALQGWCPSVELFRRLDVRTRSTTDRETYALKAVAGDFDRVAQTRDASDALRAATAA